MNRSTTRTRSARFAPAWRNAALGLLAAFALAACAGPAAKPPGAAAEARIEPIQSWTTAQGARVLFVPARSLPIVDLRLVFDAGAARDAGKAGLASLTNSLLDSGAGGLDADTIAARLEDVGARLSLGSERDMASISLRTLSSPAQMEPALQIYQTLLQQPDFPQSEVERLKRQMLVGIQNSLQDPGEVASRAFYAALYADHPYASPPGGTEASVPTLTRADVVNFHRRYYVGRNAVIAMVGDLDRAAAEALAARLSAGLEAGAPAPALPPVPPLRESRDVRIEFPSQQTHLLVGAPGMRRDDPDYYTLYVANHTFGGSGFGSRVVEEVREKRGLAYSAYSYFLPMRANGPFQMGLQTRNDQLQQAQAVMLEEFRRFVSTGISVEELDASQRNITGGAPLRIDSNSKLLGYIAMIGFYDLPLDYLVRFNARIRAVDLAGIRETLARRLDPDAMVTVVVGGS